MKKNNIYCNICNKKLNTLASLTSKCKCELYFCDKHLFFTNHNCSFDYKNEFKKFYTSNYIINISNKVIKI